MGRDLRFNVTMILHVDPGSHLLQKINDVVL
jgi:hypothetical protein